MFCKNCGKEAEKKSIKRTFLGFRKITCSFCSMETMLRLSIGLKIVYWILIVHFGIALVRHYSDAIQGGGVSVSDIIESWVMLLFFFAPIYALVRNKNI